MSLSPDSYLLLTFLTLVSGCDLNGDDRTLELFPATVKEIIAPAEVAVGSSFTVVLKGSSKPSVERAGSPHIAYGDQDSPRFSNTIR